MRSLLLLLFLSTTTLAQVHQNKPLPEINKKSVKSIDEGITGWVKSLDGQWMPGEMTIPVRAVSKDEAKFDSEHSELGLDNIYDLRLYKTNYGEEVLYILVKISRGGYFKYAATEKKWESIKTAYYYVFNEDGLKTLSSDKTTQTTLLKIPLRDFGSLGEINPKHVVEKLEQSLIIKDQTDRFLVVNIKVDNENPDKVYFQFSSQHRVFPDIEGVVNDFKLQGRTVYSSPLLLDYLHYEYSLKAFNSFFSSMQ